MRGRAVAVGAVGAVGAVVVGAFASLGGCVEEVRLFDVELRVRIADGVDPAVNVAAAGLDNERLGLSFNYFPDVGLANGGDARSLKGLPFDADASSARFELLAFIDAVNVGRGSSPVLALPERGAVLTVPILLANVDVVGALNALPPLPGTGACFSADEQGRVFVVGGASSTDSGSIFNESFVVVPLFGQQFARIASGCVAFDNSVVAVSGCVDDTDASIHDINADADVVVAASAAAEPCGAFAAKSRNEYWLFSTNSTELIDTSGAILTATAGVNVIDVEVLVGGDVLVLTNTHDLFLYRRSDAGRPVALGEALAIGRRFDDVVALTAANDLLLIEAASPVTLRSGIGATGEVTSLTVLSNDTVVAIEGANLVVYRVDEPARVIPLPRARTQVSAIPGNTLILAGGSSPGLDAISLSGL